MPAPPSSRADRIAEDIEQDIRSGRIKPLDFIGTKQDLQRRFTVAAGTLNEAIRLLRSRGVIKVKPGANGGIFAAEQSPVTRLGDLLLRMRGTTAFGGECLRLRLLLDPAIAADAARCRTAEDIAELRAIIDEMARTPPQGTAVVRVNWKLHRRIAMICPDGLIRSLYLSLMDVVEDELADVEGTVHDNDVRMEVHINLVKAIAGGDPAMASYWGGERHSLQVASAWLRPQGGDDARPAPAALPGTGKPAAGRPARAPHRAEAAWPGED